MFYVLFILQAIPSVGNYMPLKYVIFYHRIEILKWAYYLDRKKQQMYTWIITSKLVPLNAFRIQGSGPIIFSFVQHVMFLKKRI